MLYHTENADDCRGNTKSNDSFCASDAVNEEIHTLHARNANLRTGITESKSNLKVQTNHRVQFRIAFRTQRVCGPWPPKEGTERHCVDDIATTCPELGATHNSCGEELDCLEREHAIRGIHDHTGINQTSKNRNSLQGALPVFSSTATWCQDQTNSKGAAPREPQCEVRQLLFRQLVGVNSTWIDVTVYLLFSCRPSSEYSFLFHDWPAANGWPPTGRRPAGGWPETEFTLTAVNLPKTRAPSQITIMDPNYEGYVVGFSLKDGDTGEVILAHFHPSPDPTLGEDGKCESCERNGTILGRRLGTSVPRFAQDTKGFR